MTLVRLTASLGVALTTAIVALPIHAQTCLGTPSRGGLAANFGKISFGKTVGATGAIASSRVAFGLGAHKLDVGSKTTGFGTDGRFAIVVGAGRVSVCPALGLGFQQLKWDAPSGELKSTHLTGTAGVGFGYEQAISGDFSVIPFAGLRFAYTVVKYDFNAAGSEQITTADSGSVVEMQYGLLARYNFAYAGFIGDHSLKASNPSVVRWILGLTFPIKREN